MALVTASGAGPPLAMLYLMPKSSVGPPGLWLADSTRPPAAPRLRIRWLTAGVDSRPPRPTIARTTPLAAAMCRMRSMASRLKKRPSPPTTRVAPRSSGAASNTDWMKLAA